jgi:hypothetical protein
VRSPFGSTTAREIRPRRAQLASIAAVLATALGTQVACADEVDACISAAEQSQELRRDAHLRAAREKLVLCARDACPRAIQKDCKRWLGEVEAAMPTVVIHAVDAAGGDIVGARALVDGVYLDGALAGRAVALDPGEHTLRVEAGERFVEQPIVIREGERDRLLPLRFPDAAAARARPVPAGVWVLGGVGAAAITAGALLWVVGRSEHGTLYATCGVTHDCAEGDVDSARAKLVAGDIVFGAGLAAVGAAVWWGVSGASAARSPVGIQPVAGGGVVSWRASF